MFHNIILKIVHGWRRPCMWGEEKSRNFKRNDRKKDWTIEEEKEVN